MNYGADNGFRRTACIHPRRAKRKDQVCGEITVGSDGQGNHASRRGAGLQVTSSTAAAVPLPLEGKDKSTLQLRLDLQC